MFQCALMLLQLWDSQVMTLGRNGQQLYFLTSSLGLEHVGISTFWQNHHSHSQAWRREQSYGMGLYGVEWSRGAYRGSGDH